MRAFFLPPSKMFQFILMPAVTPRLLADAGSKSLFADALSEKSICGV